MRGSSFADAVLCRTRPSRTAHLLQIADPRRNTVPLIASDSCFGTPQGNDGTAQFSPIGGPTYVSEVRPGYGIQANNFPGFSFPSQQEGSTGINAGLYKPSEAVGTEANTGVTYSQPTLYIDDGEQCGGKGGECEVRSLSTLYLVEYLCPCSVYPSVFTLSLDWNNCLWMFVLVSCFFLCSGVFSCFLFFFFFPTLFHAVVATNDCFNQFLHLSYQDMSKGIFSCINSVMPSQSATLRLQRLLIPVHSCHSRSSYPFLRSA
jgi:hypothetical protein